MAVLIFQDHHNKANFHFTTYNNAFIIYVYIYILNEYSTSSLIYKLNCKLYVVMMKSENSFFCSTVCKQTNKSFSLTIVTTVWVLHFVLLYDKSCEISTYLTRGLLGNIIFQIYVSYLMSILVCVATSWTDLKTPLTKVLLNVTVTSSINTSLHN